MYHPWHPTPAATTGGAPGAAATTAPANTPVIPGHGEMSGDPHIKVQIPGEEAVCFDVSFHNMQHFLLLSDTNLKISVIGQIHAIGKRNRLAVIGITTPLDSQIEVHSEFVTVNGFVFSFEEDRMLQFSDFDLEVYFGYFENHFVFCFRYENATKELTKV